MKVTRQTHTQLIIEDRPWVLTFILCISFVGAVVATIGALSDGAVSISIVFGLLAGSIALITVFFVKRVQIIFDRPKGTITMRSKTLRSYREVNHSLGNLSHAMLEGRDTARCVLVFDNGMSSGHHPVTTYSTSGPRPKRITDAINTWLTQSSAVDSETPGD